MEYLATNLNKNTVRKQKTKGAFMLDHEQLLTFITVFELNNYSRSAIHLNLTQPAITARIQKLEIELGCKLFYRDGKKIILTEEGKVLLPFARKILNYVNEAKQTLNLLKSPTLTIGLSPAISASILLKVLSILREQHEFSFDIIEAEDSIEVSKMITRGVVDLGLVRNVMPFTDLNHQYLFPEKLVFIVGKEHPLAAKSEIHKEDLRKQTMICYRRATALWEKIDEKLVGIENLSHIEVGGFEMVKSMVKNNWGFSIIPELALEYDQDKRKKDFHIIPFREFENLSFQVTGIYKNESPKIEKLHLFLDIFKSTLHHLKFS